MGILHYILILYPVINLCEAWLEVVVIELKNPYISKYNTLNAREHLRSGVFAILVCAVFAAIAWQLELYWLLPAVALNRRQVFDFSLKLLRGRSFSLYEGDGFFDSIGRKLFGARGAWIEFVILTLITTTSIYKSL
jgi:hypothetical protein